MARFLDIDLRELEAFKNELEALERELKPAFEDVTRELGTRVLNRTIDYTPTGIYDKPVDFVTKDGKHVQFTPHTGKQGGTLKRGWQGSLTAGRTNYTFEVKNPVYYAPYVEHGHRTVNGGFVEGAHMLKQAVSDTEPEFNAMIQTRIIDRIRSVF
jgi:hypothetical protein